MTSPLGSVVIRFFKRLIPRRGKPYFAPTITISDRSDGYAPGAMWPTDPSRYGVVALVALSEGPAIDTPDGRLAAYVILSADQKFEPPPAMPRPTFVVYWPSVLEIPWIEGLSAYGSVAAWKERLARDARASLVAEQTEYEKSKRPQVRGKRHDERKPRAR